MIHTLRPTRFEAQSEGVKIVSDFDALINEKVGFKFNNKIYVLKPVDLENFMILTLAYQDIVKMVSDRSQGKEMTQDEVYECYFRFIHPLVDEFTYQDLRALPIVLLNNLVNLIMRQLAGDPTLYSEKDPNTQKKNPLKF